MQPHADAPAKPRRTKKVKSPYEALPKAARRVVDRCRAGQTLCKTIRSSGDFEHDPFYNFEPSGDEAPRAAAVRAIASGLLVASGDGLFGAAFSQAWRAA